MQTFQSKMADNQSQQTSQSAKNTDLHVSASTGIYLFYFPYSDLNSHTTEMHSRPNKMAGVVCMHMMGWRATVGQRSAQRPHSKNACSLPRGVCPDFPRNIHI